MFTVNNTPSSLTPEGILIRLNESSFFKGNRVMTENALFFLTNLYFRTIRNYDHNEDEINDRNNEFQNIGSDLLISMMSRYNYKSILNELVSLGIIEINHSYTTGVSNKGFKLNPEFLSQPSKARRFQLESSKTKFHKLDEYYRSISLKDYPYLEPMMNNIKDSIFIDDEKAREFISNSDLSDNRKNHYLKRVEAVQLRYLWNMKVAKSNQRLYNGFTSLPRDLRQFLFTVNKETGEQDFSKIEIDGSNTQPVLICIEMHNSKTNPDTEFEELCFNGELYDKIASDLAVSRRDVKDRFMDTLLFTPNNSEHLKRYQNPNEINMARQAFINYFEAQFPITYNWLLETKRNLAKTSKNNSNFQNPGGSELAMKIQRMESKLWIHEYLKTIPEGIIYFTIHDSIMIFQPTEEITNQCISLLLDMSKKLFNVEIPYKIKNYPDFSE